MGTTNSILTGALYIKKFAEQIVELAQGQIAGNKEIEDLIVYDAVPALATLEMKLTFAAPGETGVEETAVVVTGICEGIKNKETNGNNEQQQYTFDRDKFLRKFRGYNPYNMVDAIEEYMGALNTKEYIAYSVVARKRGVDPYSLRLQLNRLGWPLICKRQRASRKPRGENSAEAQKAEEVTSDPTIPSSDTNESGVVVEQAAIEEVATDAPPPPGPPSSLWSGGPLGVSGMGMAELIKEIKRLVVSVIGLDSPQHKELLGVFIKHDVESEGFRSDRLPKAIMDESGSYTTEQFRCLRAMHILLHIMATKKEKYKSNKWNLSNIQEMFFVELGDAKTIEFYAKPKTK